MRALAERGATALDEPVSQTMTRKVETCNESETIGSIMERMTTGKFRHVPVVEQGRLVGIISIGDVVKQRLQDMEHESAAMRDYIGLGAFTARKVETGDARVDRPAGKPDVSSPQLRHRLGDRIQRLPGASSRGRRDPPRAAVSARPASFCLRLRICNRLSAGSPPPPPPANQRKATKHESSSGRKRRLVALRQPKRTGLIRAVAATLATNSTR